MLRSSSFPFVYERRSLRGTVHAYDMALRGLCGRLRTSLRLGRASRVPASALCRTEFALTEGPTTQSALLRPGCVQRLQPQGHRGFAAQAQALAEVPVPEAAPSRYRIEIVTGDVRGAGTQAPAIVTLHGESGDSSEFVVGNEEENGFERGSSKMYELNIERDLGPLKRIHIEQCEPSVTETGFGWFLDKLEVTGPNGQTVTFPCHSWIGKNDAGDISGTTVQHRQHLPFAAVHCSAFVSHPSSAFTSCDSWCCQNSKHRLVTL